MAAIATLSSMIIASCSNDPAVESEIQQEIAISGHYGEPSRAVDTEPVSGDYQMWVTALYRNLDDRFYLMKNKEFVYNDTDKFWYSKDYAFYYPLQGNLDFVAVAAKTAPAPAVTLSPRIDITQENGVFYLNKCEVDYSLGRATSGRWLTGTDDVLVSEMTEDIPCGNIPDREVDLNFKHLLSNIRFTFSAETTDAEENFRVTKIEINNLYLTGKATLVRDNKGDEWKSITWSNLKNQKQLVYQSEGIKPIFNETPTTHVDFYIPEQRVVPDGASIPKPTFTIYYRYVVGNNQTDEMEYIVDRPFSFPEKIEGGKNIATWQPGKRYTYNVICTILPHIEFLVTYDEEDLNGPVIDKWVDEEVEL